MIPAVRLFVGGHATSIQGERDDLATVDRMFTAAHPPPPLASGETIGLLDSGAFTDHWRKRLTVEMSLDRQFSFEQRAGWQATGFVSYDLLIDEVWTPEDTKIKRRWSVQNAEQAVAVTVGAAHYLSSQRERIQPRTLILSCQGVDAMQYEECAVEVLKVTQPHDWIGLGGWCILGRQKRWLPTFWQTLWRVLPHIAQAGLRHVHIFGVLYQEALGGLVWLADQFGLTVSTDSTAPVLACTWKDKKRSGARCEYWRDNVHWWITRLVNLRDTSVYKQPPHLEAIRQECFL